MDIMDTAPHSVVESAEIRGEEDVTLISKVINLKSKQKELVNKVLDASDHCQDVIDMILSSTNTTLDFVQKILRANSEDLNLMRKITELNSKEWDLVRKVIHLCDGKRYFICKFMDWYLNVESLGFPCSCSGIKGGEDVDKNGTCNVKNCDGTVGEMHTVVSSYASQQGSSSEKVVTHLTNQSTFTEKLDTSCGENGSLLCKTDTCTENRSVTKEVNLTEKDGSSAERRSEEVAQPAQPAMTVKHLLCYEHLCSDSSQSFEDVCGSSVSRVEHNDFGCQLKTTKQLDDARDKGNLTSTVTVLYGTSNTAEGITGAHEEVLLNTESALLLCESTGIKKEQTVCGTNHNCYVREMKESVQELPNVGMEEAKTPLFPKQNVGIEVHEQEISNESSNGTVSCVLTLPSPAVATTGIQSRSDILSDFCFPLGGGTETQLDFSGKVFSKPSEGFVLKDCYIRLENMAHVLRGKKTVNLKDLESPQGNRMKKSISENEASDVTDCGIKGSSSVSLNTKLKKNTRQRCYGNNAKRRRAQTSEDLGVQDDTEHVLRGKETVNMKDLKRLHKNVMKEIVTENKTLTVTDWGFKGVNNTLLNVKKDTGLRCYTNNAKKRMETCNGLGSQDAVVKEKMVVEGHSEFEDLECDMEKTSLGFSIDTANNKYQNLSSWDLSAVQFACNEGMPADCQFTGGWRQHEHRVPEIQNPEVMCKEEGCYQSVENGNAVFLGRVAFHEGSASKCVEETSNIRLRVKPEFNERTGMLWRPLSREAEKALGEKENILGIQLRPFSLEQVGSLKWTQFTTYIDHPYAEEVDFMCTQ